MAGIQDFIGGPEGWREDWIGIGTVPTSASAGCPWLLTDTSAAGSPTVAVGTPNNGGELIFTFSATSEAQNLSVDFGDKLCFDIDKMLEIEFLVKTVAAFTAANTLTFGLRSARNDDPDATTANAQFKLAGSAAVVAETDDGTTDKDDISTGVSLVAAYQQFVISFASGTKDVRFSIGPRGGPRARVAASTKFDMSAYTGSLQPFMQVQKTTSTNVDTVSWDYVNVICRR